jgi:hypothetical protein
MKRGPQVGAFPRLSVVSTASAAGMAAACTVRMTVGAGFSAVILVIFLDRSTQRDYAQARIAGALHLGYGRHGFGGR